jgi:hypothetical protein
VYRTWVCRDVRALIGSKVRANRRRRGRGYRWPTWEGKFLPVQALAIIVRAAELLGFYVRLPKG